MTSPIATLALRFADASDLLPLNFFFDTFLRRDYFVRRRQLEELLSGKRHRVLIAELDGVLVGVAVVSGRERLVNLLIHPAYRNLGIGRALANESDAGEVRVKTDMSSGDPRAFYAALGFVPTGERCGRGSIEIMRKPARGARGQASHQASDGGSVHELNDSGHTAQRRRRSATDRAGADRATAAASGGLAAAPAGGDGAGVRVVD